MIGKDLLPDLKLTGVKFTEENVVFIARDKTGKLVWLERGNENAGLQHILYNHKEDFSRAFGIQSDEIALYLYEVLTNGNVVDSRPSKIQGGVDRIYEYDGDYYTFVGMGDNGFIVTSFPTRK